MKLHNSQHSAVVISGNRKKPEVFKIAQTKEMFRLMSKGVYNDQILAVIRELCCNAYDAHVAAGKPDVPFELHLPTDLEPYFEVKDFGTGLSHDDLMKLYCTYGASSKTDDNTQIGAFGIGSKSPFAYVDGFTVTSRHGGMIRHYDCHVSEEGTPTVVLLNQVKANTPDNGLTVYFPAKQEDIWEFDNKTATALEFFDPKPIVNVDIEYDEAEYLLKTPTWGLRKQENYATKAIRAIQGLVAYSTGKIDPSRMSEDQRYISGLPLDIFFPLGALSPAASRETLSNDDETIANLLQAYSEIHAEMLNQVKAKVAAASTPWEARVIINNMILSPIGKLANKAFNDGLLFDVYPNFTLHQGLLLINEYDYNATHIVSARSSGVRGKQAKFNLVFSRDRAKYLETTGLRIARGEAAKSHFDTAVTADENVLFVIDRGDVRNPQTYVSAMLQTPRAEDRNEYGHSKYSRVFLVSKRAEAQFSIFEQELVKLTEALGQPPVMELADLKKLYPAEKPLAVYVERKVLRFTKVSSNRKGWTNLWVKADHTKLPDTPKFYIAVESLQPINAKFKSADEFHEFVFNVLESKCFSMKPDTVIYGLQKNSPLRKKAGWIEFFDHVFELIPQIAPAKEAELSLLLGQDSSTDEWEQVFKKIVKEPCVASPLLENYANAWLTAKAGAKPAANIALADVLLHAASITKWTPTKVINFDKAWDQILEAYPMLELTRVLKFETREIHMRKIFDYVNMVDGFKEAAIANPPLRAMSLE